MRVNRDTLMKLARLVKGGQARLVPLAPKNDPFLAGTPTHRAMAQWFRDLWEEFGYQRGKHVRDIHYDIATRLSYTYYKHDGTPYVHTKKSYDYMQAASKAARHLGLMDDLLDDNRSDPIREFATPRVEFPDGTRHPGFAAEIDEDRWTMPEISIGEPAALSVPDGMTAWRTATTTTPPTSPSTLRCGLRKRKQRRNWSGCVLAITLTSSGETAPLVLRCAATS
jgi:hypothetical protein